jgi:hypothetical protein
VKHTITKSFWADPDTRRAQMRLEIPMGKGFAMEAPKGESSPATGKVSQFYHEGTVNVGGGADASVSKSPVSDILPRPEDLIPYQFRAISQRIVECYSVDYSRPGVLEASVPLLVDQRICKDHQNRKAEDACGRITEATWDASGANSNGYPGINIRFFVDAKIEPRLVRLLSYGGVRSGSVTVGFEWEPSHPELLEQKKFWWLLGENVDGELVRLIVTKILFYDEYSLVYEGADEDAKRLPDADDTEGAEPETDNVASQAAGQPSQPPQGQMEKTVKLTLEQKKTLGLSHAADEVADADVLNAIDRMAVDRTATDAKLAAADAIISAERAEVVRLATVAELGSAEGKLPEVLATVIANADASQLPALKQLYAEKAQSKLGTRSSQEDNPVAKPTEQAQAAKTGDVSYL